MTGSGCWKHGTNPWFPTEVARRTRELLPEAHIVEVENGPVSRAGHNGRHRAPPEPARPVGLDAPVPDDDGRALRPFRLSTSRRPARVTSPPAEQHRRTQVLLALGRGGRIAPAATPAQVRT